MTRATQFPRRAAIAAVVALGALVVGVREFGGLWAPRRKPTPYDNLFAKIDRDSAAELGQHAIASMPHFNANAAADLVRRRLKFKPLSQLLEEELTVGRIVEVGGWILPESFALVCALAAVA
jgi:hypothetical protein